MAKKRASTLESSCAPEELLLLQRILSENRFSGRHMEIGTAVGGTLKELIEVYSDRDCCPEFVVIDKFTYYEEQLENVCRNLRGKGIDPSTVTFWKGTSEDFYDRESAAGGKFDFIFIDADHRHYPVTVDLQWADLVEQGGFVCLHDYSSKFPGVIWAVDRFLKKNLNYEIFDRAGSLIALKKIGQGRIPEISKNDLHTARVVQWCYKKRTKISAFFNKNSRQFARYG